MADTDTKCTAFEKELRAQISGEVFFDEVTRGIYATDASNYQIMPVAVVVPRDAADVRAAVRCAAQHGITIVPRGGGTSLGGQAVAPSLVIDFSKYMNRILELHVEKRWVRVQPGIVLDELNAALAGHGLHFPPDPATSNRATIGGMIGNNASGSRSLVFGIMRDHVLETTVLLSDGTELTFGDVTPAELDERARGNGREAELLGGVKRIIAANRDEIEKRFPRVMRRVQGYNLDAFLTPDGWNLSKLIVGSEGTLGVCLEAKLNLETVPRARALTVIHFADVMTAVGAVAPILEHKPSAVEIIDQDVITRARESLSTAPLCGFLQGNPDAVLIVEFFGDTAAEACARAEALASDQKAKGTGYAWPVIRDPAEQARVWAVRKGGLGLLLGMKTARKPIAFIEDSCVPVDCLLDYVGKIRAFCRERGVGVVIYAHASVGVLHIRPVLDLRQQTDIDAMKAIAEYAFGLIAEYGGSLSGEHGDGRVRSPFLERFFGPQVYGAFREIKELFDPAGLMNPGVIIEPNPMEQDLRFGPSYRASEEPTEFRFRDDGGFAAAVELCTGVGACRQTLAGTMCPSYRATRDEEHSTRGRANALRLAMTGQLGPEGLTSTEVFDVLDLCLSCKACKAECPSSVDMARLKSEFLRQYHDAHGVPLREKLIAASPRMAARIAGWKAPVFNRLQRTFLFRWALERLAGFDRRRTPPAYATLPLAKWFDRRPQPAPRPSRKVVLFDDTYMSFHETSVGISAVELLESCGYEVVLARAGCCQRPRISHGFLREARTDGEQTLRNLDRFEWPVVVCEPGCASALTDDLPDLIGDEGLGRRIREKVVMIDAFLAREIAAGRLDGAFTSPFERILIHGHCHQKSLYGTTAMRQILERVPGLTVAEIDAGCCGMAGSFGYEKEHYDLSMQIGEDRLFPAVRGREAGTAVVACGFSCRHQIADGTGVKALHWVETLRGTAIK
jgi:FAD/FMN-containing dehydrogenase/Fe-S oxidoreductase